jgi:hypothetical protein
LGCSLQLTIFAKKSREGTRLNKLKSFIATKYAFQT